MANAFPNNNPFPATNSQDQISYIDCKCLIETSLTEDSTTQYEHPDCVRYNLQRGYSIGLFVDVEVG